MDCRETRANRFELFNKLLLLLETIDVMGFLDARENLEIVGKILAKFVSRIPRSESSNCISEILARIFQHVGSESAVNVASQINKNATHFPDFEGRC